jgi:predicted transcriptional regulator
MLEASELQRHVRTRAGEGGPRGGSLASYVGCLAALMGVAFLACLGAMAPGVEADAGDEPRREPLAITPMATANVTVRTQPAGLSIVVDGVTVLSPATFEWTDGSPHAVEAPVLQAFGDVRYMFTSWSDAGSANHTVNASQGAAIVASFETEYRVTVSTIPAGLEIEVDGVRAAAPYKGWWRAVSAHVVYAVEVQYPAPDVRLFKTGWSDGGAPNHTVTAGGPISLVAAFLTEYMLVLETAHGAAVCTPVPCWYGDGDTATFAIAGVPGPESGIRYLFDGWLLQPSNATVSSPLTMDGPKHLVAMWRTQVWVEAVSAYGNLRGGGWNDLGGTIHLSVEAVANETNSTRHRFVAWSGDENSTAPDMAFTARGPMNIAASWATQYRLSLDFGHGTASTVEWYDEGTLHNFSFSSAPAPPGVRWDFAGWTGNVLAPAPSFAVLMDGPKVGVARWNTSFFVTVEGGHGVPAGGGWYRDGAPVTVSVVSSQVLEGETRWRHAGWRGDFEAATGEVSFAAQGPANLTALWVPQFFLAINAGKGSVPSSDWHDAGTVVQVAPDAAEVEVNGERWQFTGWTGSITTSKRVILVTIDGPKTLTATWARVGAPPAIGPIPAAIAAVAAAGAAFIVFIRSPRGGLVLGAMAIPLFTRLRKDEVRNQFTRGRLLQFIEDNPGASYIQVRRKLGLSNGACAYHLRVLERHGNVRRVVRGAGVRFYGPDYRFDAEALPPLAYFQRRILEVMVERDDVTFAEVSAALSAAGHAVTGTNLGYHLNVLAREKGLISSRREDRKTIYFVEGARREYLRRRLAEEEGADEMMDTAALPGGNRREGAAEPWVADRVAAPTVPPDKAIRQGADPPRGQEADNAGGEDHEDRR